MALAGSRVVWGVLSEYWGNQEEGWNKYVFTAARGEKEREINSWGGGVMCDHTEVDSCGYGDTTGLIAAADGETVFYVDEGEFDEWSTPSPARVYRMDGRHSAVTTTRGALRVAASGGHIAVLLNASGPRRVLVRDPSTSRILARFEVAHGAIEVALDGSRLAVRVLEKTGSRIGRTSGSPSKAAASPGPSSDAASMRSRFRQAERETGPRRHLRARPGGTSRALAV